MQDKEDIDPHCTHFPFLSFVYGLSIRLCLELEMTLPPPWLVDVAPHLESLPFRNLDVKLALRINSIPPVLSPSGCT